MQCLENYSDDLDPSFVDCNNGHQNLKISSQGLIISKEEEDQIVDMSGDAFKINQNRDVENDHQSSQQELQISQNSLFDESDDFTCCYAWQQMDQINDNDVHENFEQKSNIASNAQLSEEEMMVNRISDDDNDEVHLKSEQNNQNQNIETIKEKMNRLDQEYTARLSNYQEEKEKEYITLKEQLQKKLRDNEIILRQQIEAERIELTSQYQKQSEAQESILKQKQMKIKENLGCEFIICVQKVNRKIGKQLLEDLEQYKQLKQKSNQSKLNLLQQKLYLNRLTNIKKTIQKQQSDLNKNCSIETSEKNKHLQKEFNQYRIQIIESIEQIMQSLDQQNAVKLHKEKELLKKEFNQKCESQKAQLRYQIAQQQNINKIIDKYAKQIFENHIAERRKFKEQQLQEEIKYIQQKELKIASYLNLDCNDIEVKQIKYDNLKQFLALKEQLNETLTNKIQKLKLDLQNSYQTMKSNLAEAYIEKLEKQKRIHDNNRQYRLVLEVFQDAIKKQKFIDEFSENIQTLETQKQRMKQKLQCLEIKIDENSLPSTSSQLERINSLKQLHDRVQALKVEDQEVQKELVQLQRKLYKLESNRQYKQYKSQIIYNCSQTLNELNDRFNNGEIDFNKPLEISELSTQQQVSSKCEIFQQFPGLIDLVEEMNLKKMKKWKAFVLNQRIIWNLQDEMRKREKAKLKKIGNKLNNDIRNIEQEFQQQSNLKKKNEFRLEFLEKQGQILKYQQSQIIAIEQKGIQWKQILQTKKKFLDSMNFYTSDQSPIKKSLEELEIFYIQYINSDNETDNLQQNIQAEGQAKYKLQSPSEYSFISQKQNFDLQYMLFK
ncbi:unnamed protein product [Paramecium octaurelia]|uniref:Uncharacterized protein n=1 Tax=Paramecium octaurelia TaxID=43137 RepID=A0A8S1WRD5_PAROT|nr:unnamed protein product [Paramecium octaurelia]